MIRIRNKAYTTYENDIRALVQSFFPGEQLAAVAEDGMEMHSKENAAAEGGFLIDVDAVCKGCSRSEDRFLDKSLVKKALYLYLSGITRRELPWGTLTGIRPVRIVEMLLGTEDPEKEQGKAAGSAPALGETGLSRVRERIRELFLVSEEKLDLMFSIYKKEQEVLARLDGAKPGAFSYRDGYSIYIGIPFCPTRCLYCSFTSNPIELWEDRVDEYLEAVKKELLKVRELAEKNEKTREEPGRSAFSAAGLQTVYIGGGTPTALSALGLDRLLTILEEVFGYEEFDIDLKYRMPQGETKEETGRGRRVPAAELTVEAGRPDSITKDKLEVLKKHGVDRISVNPQTMHQKTLDLIGRRHTVGQTVEAYRLARRLGFDNINMDLIMGLPGEDLQDVKETLRKIRELGPDSLTVHALAVKRSSRLSTEGKAWGGVERKGLDAEGMDEAAAMTALGAETASMLGLEPYYLYRQKNMAGNQDNVGYAAPGKECIYNILMMEEKHTVIGVGAGSSTKLVSYMPQGRPRGKADVTAGVPVQKSVRRFENVKNIADYLDRIDEMIKKKAAFLEGKNN